MFSVCVCVRIDAGTGLCHVNRSLLLDPPPEGPLHLSQEHIILVGHLNGHHGGPLVILPEVMGHMRHLQAHTGMQKHKNPRHTHTSVEASNQPMHKLCLMIFLSSMSSQPFAQEAYVVFLLDKVSVLKRQERKMESKQTGGESFIRKIIKYG